MSKHFSYEEAEKLHGRKIRLMLTACGVPAGTVGVVKGLLPASHKDEHLLAIEFPALEEALSPHLRKLAPLLWFCRSDFELFCELLENDENSD